MYEYTIFKCMAMGIYVQREPAQHIYMHIYYIGSPAVYMHALLAGENHVTAARSTCNKLALAADGKQPVRA